MLELLAIKNKNLCVCAFRLNCFRNVFDVVVHSASAFVGFHFTQNIIRLSTSFVYNFLVLIYKSFALKLK